MVRTEEKKQVEKTLVVFTAADGTVFKAPSDNEEAIQTARKHCREYEESAMGVAAGRLGNKLRRVFEFENKPIYNLALDFDMNTGSYAVYAFEPETEDDIKNAGIYFTTFSEGATSNIKDVKVKEKYVVIRDLECSWHAFISEEILKERYEENLKTLKALISEK